MRQDEVKVGYILRIVDSEGLLIPEGSHAKVTATVNENWSDMIDVEWLVPTRQRNGGYFPSRFEKVETPDENG